MRTLQYKVTLLSDIILNQKAATEGPNKTLDFIPGNCFLGIVAAALYKDNDTSMIPLFHSNVVRFGDAHPLHGKNRTLRVCASMYYPKLKSAAEELYISHCLPMAKEEQDVLRKKQLKQCRSGFYDFLDERAEPVETKTSFSIKSAHDSQCRISKDNAMFGYESLRKGLEMCFAVEVEDERFVTLIDNAIRGVHRVGRSRSAQYGLVEIEPYQYKEVCSQSSNGFYTVYADGRLIFLDENGIPTFRPQAEQLGVDGGTINWSLSQIRTFGYANWNGKRQCFDADRCGIEKGSVFVVEGGYCPAESQYIGSFNNEGFGKVIYNPNFLAADAAGKARITLVDRKHAQISRDKVDVNPTTPLLKYLCHQTQIALSTDKIYEMVNFWVDKNARYFTNKAFASQWGTIRALASLKKDRKSIYEQLFADKTGYLMHGIGAEKWEEGGRRDVFEEFVRKLTAELEYEEDIRLAIVNLAAEMAKRCRKEKK